MIGNVVIHDMVTKSKMTHIWCGMVQVVLIVQKGLMHAVMNGLYTIFWLDWWITDAPLITQATGDVLEKLRHGLVANFWNADGWNWSLFANLLPLDVLQKIKYV